MSAGYMAQRKSRIQRKLHDTRVDVFFWLRNILSTRKEIYKLTVIKRHCGSLKKGSKIVAVATSSRNCQVQGRWFGPSKLAACLGDDSKSHGVGPKRSSKCEQLRADGPPKNSQIRRSFVWAFSSGWSHAAWTNKFSIQLTLLDLSP